MISTTEEVAVREWVKVPNVPGLYRNTVSGRYYGLPPTPPVAYLFLVILLRREQGQYNKIIQLTWSSPKGKFVGASRNVSEELGRKPESTDLNERHPFDVEILRIPPGKAPYSYHSHSAQWEFYHVISGSGVVRHKDGTTPIEAGDAFIFKPGEPHQITNDTAEDMIFYVVADNPMRYILSTRQQ